MWVYVPLFYHSTGSKCEVECVSVGMYLCFIILQGVSVRVSVGSTHTFIILQGVSVRLSV